MSCVDAPHAVGLVLETLLDAPHAVGVSLGRMDAPHAVGIVIETLLDAPHAVGVALYTRDFYDAFVVDQVAHDESGISGGPGDGTGGTSIVAEGSGSGS